MAKSEKRTVRKMISVNGARVHNLKNISVEIPHRSLTVITGVSGSGKSSLAFDTLYAEGQRRFVESLSAYARQFLERMQKPDVDSITGIPPAVAIQQRTSARNPRSTVGTTTEVYDYMRLLYGRIGMTICKCGRIISRDSAQSVSLDLLNKNISGSQLYVLFPLSPQIRNISQELKKFQKLGFFRFVIDGEDELLDFEKFDSNLNIPSYKILILIDRFVLKNETEEITRLNDSLEAAFRLSESGRIIIKNIDSGIQFKYSSNYECPDCEIIYQEVQPRLFSFNNPFGACPSCQGFGKTIGIDEDLVIPDSSKSIRKGAIHAFHTPTAAENLRNLIIEATKINLPLDEPIQNLNEEQIRFLWEGGGEYIGLDGYFTELEEKNYKMQNRVTLARYRGYTLCKACSGSRLRTSARRVFVGGKNIPELIKLSISELKLFFDNLKLNENQLSIVSQVLKELQWRLKLLYDIGLHYLTLERLSHTLSGGESQRINLSTALGSSLVGTLYVLDEPSIGLHPRDTNRLLSILYNLRNLGNTIVVVEHDPDIIRSADYIIDMGPHAGEFGGEVVFSGSKKELLESSVSLTGAYLTGRKSIEIPKVRSIGSSKKIILKKPRKHNLQIERVDIPLGCMTVVTGVSGSGKSTLIKDILYTAMTKTISGASDSRKNYDSILGTEYIGAVELVDQTPIGRSSRSTPATYTKIFDFIRDLFASTQAAKQFGLKPGYFSFNVEGGRCDVCEGEGAVTVDMQFLPDVRLECEACKGTRYKKEARSILFRGKSIVDVLDMTVDEARVFFADENRIEKRLRTLSDVGLDYLRLGQPATMLSGGEAQRLKLAIHLDAPKLSDTMFIFDEPTTGLHLDDISKLLACMRRLTEKGHSVLIIEHNLNVMAASDWIIDIGPEAGQNGGKVVATGTPEDISVKFKTHTSQALRKFLEL